MRRSSRARGSSLPALTAPYARPFPAPCRHRIRTSSSRPSLRCTGLRAAQGTDCGTAPDQMGATADERPKEGGPCHRMRLSYQTDLKRSAREGNGRVKAKGDRAGRRLRRTSSGIVARARGAALSLAVPTPIISSSCPPSRPSHHSFPPVPASVLANDTGPDARARGRCWLLRLLGPSAVGSTALAFSPLRIARRPPAPRPAARRSQRTPTVGGGRAGASAVVSPSRPFAAGVRAGPAEAARLQVVECRRRQRGPAATTDRARNRPADRGAQVPRRKADRRAQGPRRKSYRRGSCQLRSHVQHADGHQDRCASLARALEGSSSACGH